MSKKIFSVVLVFAMIVIMCGCGQKQETSDTKKETSGNAVTSVSDALSEKKTGSLELKYATQYEVDFLEGDYSILRIKDGLSYVLIPEGKEAPDFMSEKELSEYTQIRLPINNIYLAASSAMDMFDRLGCIDKVTMTSTTASDWNIPKIKDMVRNEDILYVGKYSAPDYETVLDMNCAVAIESTMIYHSPEVKEQLEVLGIPVMVERSSYEAEPLARMEWIKLYGLLLGKSAEAEEIFSSWEKELADIDTEALAGKPPKVAFFYISSSGYVNVRKPGDYISRMIDMAGGSYALADAIISEEDANALSTMNMQMESFYDYAVDADIIIYNSTIDGEIHSLDELFSKSELLKDFGAVKSGNVWCSSKSVYQKTTGLIDMIKEMNGLFSGSLDESDMVFFHRVN